MHGRRKKDEVEEGDSRLLYYEKNYDVMTGVRIACTLGVFFLFVLLSLLYKSRGNKEGYRDKDGEGKEVTFREEKESGEKVKKEERGRRKESEFEMFPDCYDLNECSTSSIPMQQFRRKSSSSSSSSQMIKNVYLNGMDVHSGNSMNRFLRQSIDIHVIQATPTMSPSGSANLSGASRHQRYSTVSESINSSTSYTEQWSSRLMSDFNLESLNLKYVDDTESSDNIPTRQSDFDSDTHSMGSDSVFDQDMSTLIYAKRLGAIAPPPPKEPKICGQLLSHNVQVHHRDSFCSDVESLTDYGESLTRGRRSSSTQTTASDLRQYFSSFNWIGRSNTSIGSRKNSLGSPNKDEHENSISRAVLRAPSQLLSIQEPFPIAHASTSACKNTSDLPSQFTMKPPGKGLSESEKDQGCPTVYIVAPSPPLNRKFSLPSVPYSQP